MRPGRICLAAALALLGASGCAEEGPPGIVASGTSIFDRLATAEVESFPDANLATEMTGGKGRTLPMRTPVVAESEWVYLGSLPEEHRRHLRAESTVSLWQWTPPIQPAEGSPPPRAVRGGEPLPAWGPSEYFRGPTFPGEVSGWDGGRRALFALRASPPPGIQVEYERDLAAAFGDLGWGVLGGPTASGEAAARPRPSDLVQKVTLGRVSRRCLFVPTPSALRVDVGRLDAEELHVGFGVARRGMRLAGRRFEPPTGETGGVEFALEVIEGKKSTRVGSVVVPGGEVGQGFGQIRVDLRRFRGRRVSLRFLTSPGPGGDHWFDYAVLADMRFSGGETAKPVRPHVVLVDMDTLRPDRLGCYGHARPTTPRLDAWVAKQAVVYRDAHSTSSWTFPATSSMTTGLAVHQHGMTLFPSSLPEKTQTLASYLRDGGYATYGFVEGSFIGAAVGFHRGFDYYDSGYPESKEPPWERLLPLIRASRGAGPFFLFLHSYLVHAEYPVDNRFEDRERPYRGWLADRPIDYAGVLDPYLRGSLELGEEERAYVSRRYDGGVAKMDEILGDFLKRLEEAFGKEDFLLILTSDHGEELFEHRGVGHGYTLYEEILRVPLIVRFPAERGARRVGVEQAPVTTLDIVPTVLDVVGLPVPPSLPGRSLRGPLPEERLRVASMGKLTSVRLGKHKLILGEGKTPRWQAQPVELYDLRTDPGEHKNLAGERPEIVRRLEEALRRFEAAFPPVGKPGPLESEITGQDLEVLRGLGYLGAPH